MHTKRRYIFFDYELELLQTIRENKMVAILKSTGLGISEIMLRIICYFAETEPLWHNSQVCIITAPRLDLAITLIDRLARWYPEIESWIKISQNRSSFQSVKF